MQLVNLENYRRKEVVDALEALLAAAKAGEVQGLVYVVKVGPDEHRAGTVGVYRRHPEKALSATFQLERALASGRPLAGML